MELNMPRAGSGLKMRLAAGNPSRSNSACIAESSAAQMTVIWLAEIFAQSSICWPRTDVWPQGKSIFGRPIREERPAARMTAANEKFSSAGIAVRLWRAQDRNRFGVQRSGCLRQKTCQSVDTVQLAKHMAGYFNLASASLTASKLGRSLGVG